ncbi:MAG TPA: hypothetical protein VM370_06535 [Candidatus Thermoplasmatota archaeon]|nr:hypothetical protein [Candidatus Thermoplasmatota archaeon]
MRTWLLVVALVAAPIGGCLGAKDDGARLAHPTDKVPLPPRVTPQAPTTAYNFSDPGYRVTGAWKAGDGWDYESNQSHFRRVRVLDVRTQNGGPVYVVEERTGDVGQPAAERTVSWIDGRQWLLLNTTRDDGGPADRYQPGVATRFWKNGSFSYNHSSVQASGRTSAEGSVTVQSRLAGTHTTILFPWGYLEAKKVEQAAYGRDAAGNRSYALTTHYVHRDYLNDVQYQLPGGELFKLTAVKAGDFRRGKLST